MHYKIKMFTHSKSCLATTTHNFKWVKITDICLIWDRTFASLDVETLISFPITVIYPANKTVNTTIVVFGVVKLAAARPMQLF